MSLLPETISQWRALAESSPVTLAQQWQQQLDEIPPQTRRAALIDVTTAEALADAMKKTSDKGFLSGVPFLAKDLFGLAGKPMRAGSTFLDKLIKPPSTDASLIKALSDAGAICAGRTQLVEFAYGLTGENPHYGDCPHPHLPNALAGGSSSGSAWAVGKGLVPFALGTDTAGSIRVPAAFCGVYGLRLVPGQWTEGVFPLAPSVDTVGWLTRNAEDMKVLCNRWFSQTNKSNKGRALYLPDLVPFELPALRAACGTLAVRIHAEQDPELTRWLSHGFSGAARAYFILTSAEAAQVHAPWLDLKRQEYDPVVWARLDQGRRWTPAEIEQATEVRERIRARMQSLFESYDALILPVTPIPSPGKNAMNDTMRQSLLSLNTPVSLAGLPALTVPAMLGDGRSGGLQVIFPSLERMDVAFWLDRMGI